MDGNPLTSYSHISYNTKYIILNSIQSYFLLHIYNHAPQKL